MISKAGAPGSNRKQWPYVVPETGQVIFGLQHQDRTAGTTERVPLRARWTDPNTGKNYVWNFEQEIVVGIGRAPAPKAPGDGEVVIQRHSQAEILEKLIEPTPDIRNSAGRLGSFVFGTEKTAPGSNFGLYKGPRGDLLETAKKELGDDFSELPGKSEGTYKKSDLPAAQTNHYAFKYAPVKGATESGEPQFHVEGKPEEVVTFRRDGGANSPHPAGAKFSIDGQLPEGAQGAEINAETGVVTLAKPVNEEVSIPVKVTYDDGTEDKSSVVFIPADKKLNDTVEPSYTKPKEGQLQSEAPIFHSQDDSNSVVDKPENTRFELGENAPADHPVKVNEQSGVVTVELGEGESLQGPVEVPVKVVYSDNSIDTATVEFTPAATPDSSTADELTPSYKPLTVEQGETATLEAPTFDKVETPEVTESDPAPAGTTFKPGDHSHLPDGLTAKVNENTGSVEFTVGEGVQAGEYKVPVTVTYEDGSEDTAEVSVNAETKVEDPEPPAPAPVADDLGYSQDIHVAPDNFKRSDSTGTPALPDTIQKQDGDFFRFGELPEGFVRNPNPSWNGVEEIIREGADESERVLLRINKQNGKVEVNAGPDADYSLDELPVEYVGANGNLKGKDTVSVTVRPIAHSWNGEPTESDNGSVNVPYTGSKPDQTGDLTPSVTKGDGEATLDENGNINYTPGADDKPGSEIKVTVSDSDGNPVRVVEFKVPLDDAAKYEPKWEDSISEPATPTITIPNTGDAVPADTGFEYSVSVHVENQGDDDWQVDFDVETREFTVTPGSDAQPGDLIQVEVGISYPDGSEETVTFEVAQGGSKHGSGASVDVPELKLGADDVDPKWEDSNTGEGDEFVTIPNTGDGIPDDTEVVVTLTPDAENGGSLPWDVRLEEDGSVTVVPGADAEVGDSAEVSVELTYPDGSKETKTLTVGKGGSKHGSGASVDVPELKLGADDVDPKWEDSNTGEGDEFVTIPNTGDGIPDDTEVVVTLTPDAENEGSLPWDVRLEEDGSVTVVPGADAEVGDSAEVSVELTYPDGSKETKTLTVGKGGSKHGSGASVDVPELKLGADDVDPKWDEFSGVEEDGSVVIPNVGDSLPEDAGVGALITPGEGNQGQDEWDISYDSATGALTVTPGADAKPGDFVAIDVDVFYGDDSEDSQRIFVAVTGDGVEYDEGLFDEAPLTAGGGTWKDLDFSDRHDGDASEVEGIRGSGDSRSDDDLTADDLVADGVFNQADRIDPKWEDTGIVEGQDSVVIPNVGDGFPADKETDLNVTLGHGAHNKGQQDWDFKVIEGTDSFEIIPGADAKVGDSVTITVEVKYPDGSTDTETFTVTVTEPTDGSGDVTDNDDSTTDVVVTEAPTVNPVNPGDNVITGTGKAGATITVTGPNGFSTTTKVNENGNWSIDVPGGAVPESQYIVSQKDGEKAESDQVIVTVGKGGGELVNPGLSSGSSNFDIPKHLQCAVFAGGVTAIPLILLSPMHNMYEMMINPHLNGLREQFHRELHALDQQVRRGLGVEGHPALQFMDHINARVNEFNQQLGQVAHDNRHIGLAAAAIAVAGLSFQHCMNTQAASSSSASSVGSSSSSQEQAPARNEAKEDNAGGIVGWFQGLFNRK
ncbi:Rib/alpha-like domain-containing protein [Corynebacterium propinquum]|uniref:Rib/alpha-like domain-containing protein n=1 Tax=Corynebacterium propinquum TaxID=43769 RepID=UPI00254CD984|nr:Rib/alpha-like domain-containing protein [Corynebacterium propinquum]MDK8722098.1 Rib/alpha-like domain-containing protein [Corynebacterium propinquum]